jgi:hypothetical protein
MKYVFLVAAEHQMAQVDIAIRHFKINPDSAILLIQDINGNNVLYNKLIGIEQYGEIVSFSSWIFSDLLRSGNKSNDFVLLCDRIYNACDNVIFFASHYSDDSTLLFLKIVKPITFFLMDEGTASFSVQAQRSRFQLLFKIKVVIKSLVYKKIVKIPKKLTYFTKFDFIAGGNDTKELYSISKSDITFEKNDLQFAFLGSSIVEMGMLSEKLYLDYLKLIVEQNGCKFFFYYAHRKETSIKLASIADLGFEIVLLDVPFEVFFSNQKTLPSILGSFFTTSVLLNISHNFLDIPILNIYVFPLSKLKKERLVYIKIVKYLKRDLNFNHIKL